MNLCKECYAELKTDPTLVRIGVGIAKFNGKKSCDNCSAKIERYVVVEKTVEEQSYISKNTLDMMDTAMDNFAKGIVSKAVDLSEIEKIVDRMK